MQRVAIETPTPISAMVYKDGIFNVMDKAFALPTMQTGWPTKPLLYILQTKWIRPGVAPGQRGGLISEVCLERGFNSKSQLYESVIPVKG